MSALDALLNLLYPPKCAFCRALLEERGVELVCPRCRVSLPYVSGRCRKRAEFVEEIAAPLYYKGVVRDSIHRCKFSGARQYLATYGSLAARAAREQLTGTCDAVCWAPLSQRRLRQRGFDQARGIAEALGAALDLPVLPLLEKTRDTPPQSRTGSAAARRANITGCYRVTDPAAAGGRRLLLVDDVITSGATAGECARMLLLAGAAELRCAALAVTEDDKK